LTSEKAFCVNFFYEPKLYEKLNKIIDLKKVRDFIENNMRRKKHRDLPILDKYLVSTSNWRKHFLTEVLNDSQILNFINK